jgi:hypothetical protein
MSTRLVSSTARVVAKGLTTRTDDSRRDTALTDKHQIRQQFPICPFRVTQRFSRLALGLRRVDDRLPGRSVGGETTTEGRDCADVQCVEGHEGCEEPQATGGVSAGHRPLEKRESGGKVREAEKTLNVSLVEKRYGRRDVVEESRGW